MLSTAGQLVSLFGDGLGVNTTVYQPENGVYSSSPSQPGSVHVTFNDIPAPILYSSPHQANVQVPYEIAGQSSVHMQVQPVGNSSVLGPAIGSGDYFVVSSQPSAFIRSVQYANCGQATSKLFPLAINPDGRVSDCGNQAPAGSVMTLYLNGLGLAGGNPITGAVSASPATGLAVASTANGVDLVTVQTGPGQINSVWVV